MARLARLCVAGQLHHIIQRGNNGQPVFATEADFHTWLVLLAQHARSQSVAIHAYVLMPNHVHLLATPESADGLPRLMQAMGRSYVRYFNNTHQRSGTLWEGRYRSTVLEARLYGLACMAYIDLNPVRAGLVDSAALYPWSSHAHYLGRAVAPCITPHALYWELGNTPFAREAAYAQRVREGLSAAHTTDLTDAALQGWALGSPAFVAQLQKATTRRLAKAKAGRPAIARP